MHFAFFSSAFDSVNKNGLYSINFYTKYLEGDRQKYK